MDILRLNRNEVCRSLGAQELHHATVHLGADREGYAATGRSWLRWSECYVGMTQKWLPNLVMTNVANWKIPDKWKYKNGKIHYKWYLWPVEWLYLWYNKMVI